MNRDLVLGVVHLVLISPRLIMDDLVGLGVRRVEDHMGCVWLVTAIAVSEALGDRTVGRPVLTQRLVPTARHHIHQVMRSLFVSAVRVVNDLMVLGSQID
jgi:hypothetical protein